jgi:hypothetical protein
MVAERLPGVVPAGVLRQPARDDVRMSQPRAATWQRYLVPGVATWMMLIPGIATWMLIQWLVDTSLLLQWLIDTC